MSSSVKDLTNSLVTKAEVSKLLEEIESLAETVYKTDDKSFKSTILGNVTASLAVAIRSDLGENDAIYEDKVNLEKWFRQIRETLRSIEVVTVETAWEPRYRFVEQLAGILTKQLKKQIVVDMRIDRQLIGGARVTFGGKVCEYSLRSIWEQVWREVEARLQK